MSAEPVEEVDGKTKFESKADVNDLDRLVLEDSSSDAASRRSQLAPEAALARPSDENQLSQGSQVSSKASKKRKYSELKKNLFGGLDKLNSYSGEVSKKRPKANPVIPKVSSE